MIIRICAWCSRPLTKDGSTRGEEVSPEEQERIRSQGNLLTHGVCEECKKALV